MYCLFLVPEPEVRGEPLPVGHGCHRARVSEAAAEDAGRAPAVEPFEAALRGHAVAHRSAHVRQARLDQEDAQQQEERAKTRKQDEAKKKKKKMKAPRQ